MKKRLGAASVLVAIGVTVVTLACSSSGVGKRDAGGSSTDAGTAGADGGRDGAAGAAGVMGATDGAVDVSDSAAGTTGGSGGTTGGTGGKPSSAGNSVTTRNNHETRDGFFIQPTITKARAAMFGPDMAFNAAATYDGSTWASPLYLEDGPGGKGVFFVVTTNDNVYALDETTGKTVWMRNIGPAPQSTLPCGGSVLPIHPVGIMSTPVIDVAPRTIFVAGVVGASPSTFEHEVHALSVDTGVERPGWPVIVSKVTGNIGTTAVPFHAPTQYQRGSLSLVGGILYVPYGGYFGDCSIYHGWIVAIDISDPTRFAGWVTAGYQAGIWAAGGMASDGDGVFATTGNQWFTTPAEHEDTEELVHVTGMGKVDRTTGIFYPTHWRTMDEQDADFAASSPVILKAGGSSYVGAVTKDGHFYLLNPANLGGMGGHVAEFIVSNLGPMVIRTVPAAYVSSTGTHVVMNAAGPVCPSGTKGTMVSLLITPGSPPTISSAWCSTSSDASPIATSTNGKDETVVWFAGPGIMAADGDTGAPILANGGNCPGIQKWTSPIAVKGRILVAADGHLCSWSAH